MSDTSITIVPLIANYPNREHKAQQVLSWLISINAVKSHKTDCTLSSELGYPIGEAADKVTQAPQYLPYKLIVNGLDIVTERTIFHTGENGLDSVICPHCHEDILSDALEFFWGIP